MQRYIQFSIFLVNKPGVMSQLFSELARAKLNITSIAMMDSMEHGVMRLIVDDPTPPNVEVSRILERPINANEPWIAMPRVYPGNLAMLRICPLL